MFATFRQRLLFWFLVFIATSFLFIALSISYIQNRENILKTSDLVEDSYLALLRNVLDQQDFFSYETKNGVFFETGISTYLEKYHSSFQETKALVQEAAEASQAAGFKLSDELPLYMFELTAIDSVFQLLVKKVKERGYKDFNLEGSMRVDAHWLEEIKEIPSASVLSLRRHEKDYIIRNDTNYVLKLNHLVETLVKEISLRKGLMPARKELIISRLKEYNRKFSQLVALDKELGIKDNSGLKLALDERIKALEGQFQTWVNSAKAQKEALFYRLNLIFGLTGIGLVLLSILLSSIISKRITQPLTELTTYITRFVDSNFTLSSDNPIIRSKDEIGKLTENFTILKDEIISQLTFFKQKVEERTQALAGANEQLKRINAANSRFVPQKFLHILGRESIEQVRLGDQIEAEMTIMFTDIRSFTQISESLSPQENFDFINAYLHAIVPIIQTYNGVIDKYIGDSVMALFPNDPEDAIKAALNFNQAVKSIDLQKIKPGLQPIEMGVGIHTGKLILGTIGHNDRLETTVISDAVNIASRVEGLNKFYGTQIIATSEALDQLGSLDAYDFRFLDQVNVKGKSKPISIFEFLTEEVDQKRTYQSTYQSAIKAIEENQLELAISLLREIQTINQDDLVVNKLLKRLNDHLLNDNNKEWDNIKRMEQK